MATVAHKRRANQTRTEKKQKNEERLRRREPPNRLAMEIPL